MTATIDQIRSLTTELWPLALARVSMGVLWLFSLRWKLPPSFDGRGETSLRAWLELEIAHPAFGFYGELIESIVLPNFATFAWIVFTAELVAGLSLLAGAFTRFGALLGLAMSINLGIGLLEVPGEWPWSYAMMALLHGLIFISNSGRVFGLDALRRSTVTHN